MYINSHIKFVVTVDSGSELGESSSTDDGNATVGQVVDGSSLADTAPVVDGSSAVDTSPVADSDQT